LFLTRIHPGFGQWAIAEEFVDRGELHVGGIGNDDKLEIRPITEMGFDKRKTADQGPAAPHTSRSGCSRPMQTISSATGTTWHMLRPKPEWNTPISSAHRRCGGDAV
jgi:hypothetical protein